MSGGPERLPPADGGRHRRLVRAALVVGLLAVVTGLAVADRVRDDRRAQRAAETGSVRLAVTAAVPTGAGRPGFARQDARLDLTVRNDGPSVVRVLEQRLDGGVPVDPGPATAVAAGATAVLAVRWRVLCAEVGSLYGPRSLDLVVRTRSGDVTRTRIPLGPPLGELRRAFRRAAADACEVLVR